jgi:alpha-glucosidase (family GH31 glycosyl hydrolase)
MNTRCGCSRIALLAGLAIALPGPQPGAAVKTLKSSILQLELTTNPYSFRVLERSTRKVLVSHSRTAFTQKNLEVASATDVRIGSKTMRAALLVSGSDKKAQATFTFIKPEILQVVVKTDGGDPGEILEEFNDQGEHYYGIWEYPFGGNVDNRGADRAFRGIRNMPAVNLSNARAPFYVTSGKYGIYVESTALAHYKIAVGGRTSFSFQDAQLKYDILYGPGYSAVLNRYNTLAGPAFMPPTWAFGSIWWRDDHHADLRGVANAQEKVIDDADQLKRLQIPASAIWLDRPFGTGARGWGNMDFDPSFPDPAKMIRDLKDRGMFLLIWIANRCSNALLDEGSAKGYLFPGRDWPAADLRNPAAYNWFKERLNAYVRLGVRGYKIDRGEEGELPDSVENLNAILFPKLAAEGLADAYGRDYFTFSRNVNDTGRKYTAVWNGDTRATFAGLAVSVKHAVRCGAINFPMWGSDTGGYIGRPDKELFARWLEFSAYCPMTEVLLGPKRTIWSDYDDELVAIAREQVRAHHDLIPYTRSFMLEATRSGFPIVRPLIFVYPDDASLVDTWDEYMYGSEILVAPVTSAGATSREVYLPAGGWMDYKDRTTVHHGPATISAQAPLGTIPLFVREGAIVTRGDILKANNSWQADWAPRLRIEVFPSNKVPGQVMYFTGKTAERITSSASRGGIRIQFGDLGAAGFLEIYCRNATGVTRNGESLHSGAGYSYDEKAKKLTVPFSGATTVIVSGATDLFAP